MNGFEKRKQEKINDILAAAFELFRKEGIEAVKITDIAEKANVSKVSIYNYFGSKEELAKQVMFNYMDKKAEKFKEFMTSNLSFKEKYNTMITENMNAMGELAEGENGGLIDNALLVSPQVQQFLQSYAQTKIIPLFIKFIEQGKEEGDIDNEIETDTILMYMQAINGVLQSPLTIHQRVDLGKLIFFGLKGKS